MFMFLPFHYDLNPFQENFKKGMDKGRDCVYLTSMEVCICIIGNTIFILLFYSLNSGDFYLWEYSFEV